MSPATVLADNLAEVPTSVGTQAGNKRYRGLARGVPYVLDKWNEGSVPHKYDPERRPPEKTVFF